MAHPNILVNLKDGNGQTPLSLGCFSDKVSAVKVLLKDPRVDITLADDMGHTPLWWASCRGYLEIIEWLIASGRNLGDVGSGSRKNLDGNTSYTVIGIARKQCHTEIVSLLKRLVDNPAQTRQKIHFKLGMLDELASENFALVIFLCDDLLQLNSISNVVACDTYVATARFFAIAKRLPMELQMILCHRIVGSTKNNILHKDSENAFKCLARSYF